MGAARSAADTGLHITCHLQSNVLYDVLLTSCIDITPRFCLITQNSDIPAQLQQVSFMYRLSFIKHNAFHTGRPNTLTTG